MLTQTMIKMIENFPMGMVATTAKDGWPATSPKASFFVLSDTTLCFAHIRSPNTWANLKRDPRLETVFFDPFIRKALRIKGTALCHEPNTSAFDTLFPLYQRAWPELAPRIKGIVNITLTACSIVTTPPYDDGATEQEMISLYQDKYRTLYP